jgi:alpha-galactosidase
MPIVYNKKNKVFHLQTKSTSYIFQLYPMGYLVHKYWGKKINSITFEKKSIFNTKAYDYEDMDLNIDSLMLEFSGFGYGDFREPSFQVEVESGNIVCDMKYQSHKIFKGKMNLKGLPSVYIEEGDFAETLEIILEDNYTGLNIILSYTVIDDFDVITRSVKFINNGNQKLKILSALSMQVDFNSSEFDFLNISGTWTRERDIYLQPLKCGTHSIESKRGISSHQHNPFIALVDKNATETRGNVYGFSLIYSGNFIVKAEVDQFFTTRVLMGINPFNFKWSLNKNTSFQTPEVVMVFSGSGLGKMSRIYHNVYRKRLCRGIYRDKVRPILINNWEATYFDFTAKKIENIAKVGKELGLELFVLDDGWFGKRNSDNCSLGDWFVDFNKLPEGLDSLAKNINKTGLNFGLWFEPEMISPDSDLYRKHPDWCLHVPNRIPSSGKNQRNQLVLDLTRDEVCNEIIKMVSDILKSVPISYVKWDMNRPLTDVGSAVLDNDKQMEVSHRYVLGLYKIMEKITNDFPNVLFESCAGGGARFDPGILYYMPQTWASDNTDAIQRLKIQYGTSLVYPVVTIGSHVSTVPNHQLGRITDLDIRGNVAMCGTFGYELDLTNLTNTEKETIKKQVELFKDIRKTIQFGNFYRLLSPFEGNETAWMFISKDEKEVIAFYFKILAEPAKNVRRLRLQGLNKNYLYEIIDNDIICTGEELMNVGIEIINEVKDFSTYMWKLKLHKSN